MSPVRSILRPSVLLRAALAMLLGAVLLAGLVWWFGTEETAAAMSAVQWRWVGAAAVVYALQIPTLGLRWWLALRLLGHRVDPLVMIRVNTASNLLNFCLPGHFGEPLTSWWLSRTAGVPMVPAFSSILACKTVGSLLNLFTVLAFAPALGDTFPEQFQALLGSFAIAMLGATSIGLVALSPRAASLVGRIGRTVVERSARLLLPLVLGRARGRQMATSWGERSFQIWEKLRLSLRHFASRPRALALIGLVSLVKLLLCAFSFHLLLRALGIHSELSWMEQTFVPILNILGDVVSIYIPFNLGLQEALLGGLLRGLGIAPGPALGAALLHKVVALIQVVVSLGLVVALAPLHQLRAPPADAAPPEPPAAPSAAPPAPAPPSPRT